jgi:hypothetical protein
MQHTYINLNVQQQYFEWMDEWIDEYGLKSGFKDC